MLISNNIMPESILDIFVVTYNRAPFLKRTLGYLAASCLCDFPITVLNNASTDDTTAVVQEAYASLPNLKLITHHANIGANANILRAFDYSRARYTWILCDDDVIDLSQFSDVLHVLNEGEIDFVHIGAHEEKAWDSLGGSYETPRELLAKGYPYFKFSSFIPCNIFKTSTFLNQYLIPGYNNIGNAYPHMPFAIGIFKQDLTMYVSQKQIVTASIGGQSYNMTEWFSWWMRTCELLKNPAEVRRAFLDQWKHISNASDREGLMNFVYSKELVFNEEYVTEFKNKYLTNEDKAFIKRQEEYERGIKQHVSTHRWLILRKISAFKNKFKFFSL
jgi:glycosyltransferase involved in cell wall biosynthesis